MVTVAKSKLRGWVKLLVIVLAVIVVVAILIAVTKGLTPAFISDDDAGSEGGSVSSSAHYLR